VLSAVNPLHNEEIPDTITTLIYSADYDLDPATVEPSFTLTNTTTGTQLNPTVDVSGKDINVNVGGLLEHSSAYTAEFDADIIRGLNGEKPAITYSFSFTTEVVLPPPVFTTPEGFLQLSGDFYDGKYYVGGYGPNDEGFITRFNWDGDSVWFKDFRINGQYTRITDVEVNSTGIYSLAMVNKIDPVNWEVWLYHQSLDGGYLNQWQLTSRGVAFSITSSSTDIYLSFTDGFTYYVQQYNANGYQAEATYPGDHGVYYHNGYVYVGGGVEPNGGLFLTKLYSNLSDSLWYREVIHSDVAGNNGGYVTYMQGQLWLLGIELDSQIHTKMVLQRYSEDGSLMADRLYTSEVDIPRDFCSDNTYTYYVCGLGLYKIDNNGNRILIDARESYNVFRADDPSGQNHKVAITDRSNKLKLYSR